MANEKLILNKISKVVKAPVARYPRIRVDRDIYIKIAQLATDTNQTINDITSQMLAFALDHTEVGEEVFVEVEE